MYLLACGVTENDQNRFECHVCSPQFQVKHILGLIIIRGGLNVKQAPCLSSPRWDSHLQVSIPSLPRQTISESPPLHMYIHIHPPAQLA
jgi:hypothetical protein